MFKTLERFDSARHGHWGIELDQPYHFASAEMLVPVVNAEIERVAREYPVVFPREGLGVPLAILGLKPGHNASVTGSGHWVGRYIPAHLRRYPFQLAAVDEGSVSVTPGADVMSRLQIDVEAPHWCGEQGGEPLLTQKGEPSPLLTKVLKLLLNLQYDYEQTCRLVAQLSAAGLLREQTLLVRVPGAPDHQLSGFSIVDPSALKACSMQRLGELNASGALRLAFAQRASLTNLQDGILAHALRASKQGAQPLRDERAWLGLDTDSDLEFHFH